MTRTYVVEIQPHVFVEVPVETHRLHIWNRFCYTAGMVRMTLVLVASQPRADHLVQALRSLMVRTRIDPACLTCSVWLDMDSTVRYVEEWATEADMERRVRSDIFTWLLAVMEGAEEPPEIRFDFHALSRGLDYVREIRQLPHSQ